MEISLQSNERVSHMQEITYDDIIRHYQVKLGEIQEELEKMQNTLKDIEAESQETWSGPNADLFNEKMWTVKERVSRTEMNLDDAQQLLAKIRGAMLEYSDM